MPSELEGKLCVFVRSSGPARRVWYEKFKNEGADLVLIEPDVVKKKIFGDVFPEQDWIVCDTQDLDVLESRLHDVLKQKRREKFDAILSFDEFGIYPAIVMAKRLHCIATPCSADCLRQTHVKSLFREWCSAHDITSPRAVSLLTPAVNARHALEKLIFPIVLKPSPGSGSSLARKVDTLDEAVSYVDFMWRSIEEDTFKKYLEVFELPVHIVGEEYIGGTEVDIDCVVEQGELRFASISDNFDVEPPFFREKGGVTPSQLPASQQTELHALLSKFVSSHEKDLNGVFHFEAKYDHQRGKPYVIEVNCRPGGAETGTMIQTVYGLCLGECQLRLALGLGLEPILPRNHSLAPRTVAASVNMYSEKEGTIKSFSAPSDPFLVAFSAIGVGKKVAPPPKLFGCWAWMVATGATSEEAKANVDRLTAKVVLELE